jgi:hypothetical protein
MFTEERRRSEGYIQLEVIVYAADEALMLNLSSVIDRKPFVFHERKEYHASLSRLHLAPT